MEQNKATQRLFNKEEKTTLVMWDINGCPIPGGYDPRLVGPRIESALKKSGYSGPLTITAIGDLRVNPGDKVLRELSSTGIALKHSHDIEWALDEWTDMNPSPATIMLISGPDQLELLADILHGLEQEGYRILLAYLQRDPALWKRYLLGVCQEWLWKTLLEGEMDSGTADNKQETTRLVLPDLCPETDESPWFCSVCDFAAQSIEDLTTHLKSVKHAYSEWDGLASHHGVNRFNVKPGPPNNDPDTIKEWESLYEAGMELRMNLFKKSRSEEKRQRHEYEMMKQYNKKDNKTLVLWHINSCPFPDGYDSRLFRPRIESAVKNSGFSGSVTITAIGSLTQTPGVLQVLSSTGIAVKHSHAFGVTYEVEAELYEWTRRNPSPATIMLISGLSQLEYLAPLIHELHFEGYTILLAYPQRDPAPDSLWRGFLLIVHEEWLWKSLLEGEMDSGSADNKQETTRLVLPGESPWYCSVCLFAAQSFKDLNTHVKSVNHAFSDWDLHFSDKGVNPFKVKPPEPPKDDPDTIKENCHIDKMMIHNEMTQKKNKMLVLWHINSCPIPDGYGSRLVRPKIEYAVKNSGFSGSVTITAIGILAKTPGVLQLLTSTGIAVKYPHTSEHTKDIEAELYEWTNQNPSPASIMLISGTFQLLCLSPALHRLHSKGYTILLAYPRLDRSLAWLRKNYLDFVQREWLWKRLLKGEMCCSGSRLVLQDECSETGESPWITPSIVRRKKEKQLKEMVKKERDLLKILFFFLPPNFDV